MRLTLSHQSSILNPFIQYAITKQYRYDTYEYTKSLTRGLLSRPDPAAKLFFCSLTNLIVDRGANEAPPAFFYYLWHTD